MNKKLFIIAWILCVCWQVYSNVLQSIEDCTLDDVIHVDMCLKQETREWGSLEKRIFSITLSQARTYLPGQQKGIPFLNMSLYQLETDILHIFEEKYEKEKLKQPCTFELMNEYQTYKDFLLAIIPVYYSLMYISKFHTKTTCEHFIKDALEDAFFSSFLIDRIKRIDFSDYKTYNFDFKITGDDVTQVWYPYEHSFLFLGALCIAIDNKLFLFQTKELLKNVFMKKSYGEFFNGMIAYDEYGQLFKKNLTQVVVRSWDAVERKIFVIAMSRVRAYLAQQRRGYIPLKASLKKLKEELEALFINEYKQGKGINASSRYTEIYTCEQYKDFLLSSCLIYYFLMYFSKFYTKDTCLKELKIYVESPFFGEFFDKIVNDLDFEEYKSSQFNFTIDPERECLQIVYPKQFSFFILASLCLQYLLNHPESLLFRQVNVLIRLLYAPGSYMKFFQAKLLFNEHQDALRQEKKEDDEDISWLKNIVELFVQV